MDTLRLLRHHAPIIALAVLALAAAACTNDTTAPPVVQLDQTFAGYSNPDSRQTTCGNCHVNKQASWAQTGHARAWSDLEASGHASESCYKCHTTNGATNIGADTAGYFNVSDAAKKYYQDVQCEACHGPGSLHVVTPDEDGTKPIPYFTSGDSGLTKGCGACHQGTHNPFYEDWSTGAHGGLEAHAISYGGSCLQCHEGRTVATRFGESSVYVEASSTTAMPVGCNSCHDAHGTSNTHELRASITVRDSTNLCVQCHKRRSVPDLTTSRGPHSPQGPTFLGYAGWQPTGFTWNPNNIPTHSDPTANPQLCATCHLATFSVGSGASFVRNYTGHKFYAVPCLAADGTTDTTNVCDVSQRTFAACAKSGCHASQAAARTLYTSLDQDLRYFADVLWHDTNGNDTRDAGDTGLLMSVPASEFTVNSTMTAAKGAIFNVRLLNTDRSHGVHNPPYLRSLLIATINAVKSQYGLAVPPAAESRMALSSR